MIIFRIIVLLNFLFIIGCIKEKENSEKVLQTTSKIDLNPKIDSLLNAFIASDSFQSNLILVYSYPYEEKLVITFCSKNPTFKILTETKPLLHLKKKQKDIYFITGSEQIFDFELKLESFSESKQINPSRIVSYLIMREKIEMIEDGIPPYSSPPEKIEIAE